MEIRYKIKDMSNPNMSNEMAIDLIQKNMPDPKRNEFLHDALIKAIVALKHDRSKRDEIVREKNT